MEISITSSSFFFSLFYLLAVVFVFIMIIGFSIKKRYPISSILLMLTIITVFAIVGSRLITIPIQEWYLIFTSQADNYNDRSAIGILVFGLIGLLVSIKIFRIKKPLLDLFAWLVPIALGIQKIGCFLNGCCYGTPTNFLFAVKYPKGTHAHFDHWNAGIIEFNSINSNLIHPVQLYESLGLFTLGYIVFRSRNLWKRKIGTLIFGLCLFFGYRFFIEFLRDPLGSQFNDSIILGIRKFQWILITFSLCLAIILFFFEKYTKELKTDSKKLNSQLYLNILSIVILSFAILLLKNFLTKYELLAICIKFVPALILTFYALLNSKSILRYRVLSSIFFLIPIYAISQTAKSNVDKDSESYHRIDVGGAFGNFLNTVSYNPQQGECGTSYDREDFEHVYSIGGLGYSKVSRKGNEVFTYGGNIHAGSIKTKSLTNNIDSESTFVFAFNPFATYDSKWLGFGGGLQIGDLRKYSEKSLSVSNLEDVDFKKTILPEFYLRLGPRNILDFEYSYGFLFPSPYPALSSRISIGSAFGLDYNYSFRYGVFSPTDSKFISAEGLLTDEFGAYLMYIFKEDHSIVNQGSKGKLVFGINYRFNYKRN